MGDLVQLAAAEPERADVMATFTPGPWKSQGVAVFSGEGAPLAIAETIYRGLTREQACVNARLIAAAPTLLAALKIAQELLERNGIHRPEIDAAIAEAR